MRSLIHTDGHISCRIASKHLIPLINSKARPSKNDPPDTPASKRTRGEKKCGRLRKGEEKKRYGIYIYKMKKKCVSTVAGAIAGGVWVEPAKDKHSDTAAMPGREPGRTEIDNNFIFRSAACLPGGQRVAAGARPGRRDEHAVAACVGHVVPRGFLRVHKQRSSACRRHPHAPPHTPARTTPARTDRSRDAALFYFCLNGCLAAKRPKGEGRRRVSKSVPDLGHSHIQVHIHTHTCTYTPNHIY